MNWREQIEAQIAALRVAYCTEDADAMQALLDVAVAAERFGTIIDDADLDEKCEALYPLLDKLREVSDE